MARAPKHEYTEEFKNDLRNMLPTALVEKYGYSINSIYVIRSNLGIKAAIKGNAKRKYDWKKVDWTRSTKALSEELDCSKTTLSAARKKYAPETLQYRPTRTINNGNATF